MLWAFIGLSHNYPLKRGQEPFIRDGRQRWLPFSQVSASEQHLRLMINPNSRPFYTATVYWYLVDINRMSHFLFQTTIKCNVSRFNPLLIIGNPPYSALNHNTKVEYCSVPVTGRSWTQCLRWLTTVFLGTLRLFFMEKSTQCISAWSV